LYTNFPFTFRILNSLKQEDALSPVLLIIASQRKPRRKEKVWDVSVSCLL
jgi:hypothetical protein